MKCGSELVRSGGLESGVPVRRAGVGAVPSAYSEYLRYRVRLCLLAMEGKVDYHPDYDYKALRNLRPKAHSPV